MSDGTLSQDEIDALLQGTDELMSDSIGSATTPGFSGGGSVSGENLSESDKATLGELLREIGQVQATALSTLTGISCKFSSPFIDSGELESLKREVRGRVIQAKVTLSGGISGEWVYVVPDKSVLSITNILIGQDDNTDLSDLVVSTFGEVISQTTGSLVTVLNEKLGKPIAPGVPHIDVFPDAGGVSLSGGAYVVRMNYIFNIEGKGTVKFYVFIPITLARTIVSSYSSAKAAAVTSFGAGNAQPQQVAGVPIRPAAFEALQSGVESEGMGNIALLLDVPMRVTVELGRTRMTIKDILGLGEGSIIELDKLAGEPVDILINDKLIAQGEVVVIDENFAVRVTKIVTPMERIFDTVEPRI